MSSAIGAGDDEIAIAIVLKELRKFLDDAKQAREGIKGVGDESEKTKDKTAKAGLSLERFSKGAKRSGRRMTLGMTLPILGLGAAALHMAGNYQESLNVFESVSGATARQMDLVDRHAQKLGNDINLPGASAADAAVSMTELSKAGLSVRDSMAAARGSLQLAALDGISVSESAVLVGDSLNAFELPGKKASKIVDMFAASGAAASGSARDAALALQQVGAVAHMVGMPIEQTVTGLTMLAKQGIRGSDAGTSMKTMLMNLVSPTKKSSNLMKDYGIQLRDREGNLKSLSALANEFTGKLGGLNKAERDAALGTIFGTDSIRAANIMLMHGGKAVTQMQRKVTKQGVAARLSAAKMKGFNGAMEAFKSAAESAGIVVGTMLLPKATALMRWATRMTNRFSELSPQMRWLILAFLTFAALLGPVTWGVGAFVGALLTLRTALLIATGQQTLLNAVTAAFPVFAVIAAIALLVAGFVWAYKNVSWFRNAVNVTWSWIKRNWPLILGILAGPVGVAVVLIIRHWDTLKGAASSAVGAVKRAWESFVSFIKQLPSRVAGVGESVGKSIANGIIGAINGAISSINSTLSFSVKVGVGPVSKTFKVDPPNIPTIPQLAEGGTAVAPGVALVGEDGPEILEMQRGATVRPLPDEPLDLRELLAVVAGAERPIEMDVFIDGGQVQASVNRRNRRDLRRR